MQLIQDEVKARRLARVMMDNVEQYNPALVKMGIEEGTIFELLHDQIEEARVEFNMWVIPELTTSRLFDYAIVDVLVKRAYKHREAK
ncbi:MAG: hypothetical protein OEL57_03040 [Trichlorobacter sp.]|uniref:hypothetical protein n=1 Tax=Trichlorobacter sp. TaxID=2911007 RepID=UPI002561E189|nr:hypothetical protein [Trichlorobacter sp.]MDK9716866.1 hypothetical protein [Trichlorobacter sp.]